VAAADALGAKALAREIRKLGARARIDLEPVPSNEPPGARQPATPGTSIAFTARERQVLELLAEGLTNRRIAESLFITEKTVSVHVTHILEKLQVTNRGEAGALARGHGKTHADSEVTAANDPSERGKVRTPRRLTRDLGLRKYRDACVRCEAAEFGEVA
jgi:DNA-binding CsgD family transcriptional regulator